MSGARPVVEGPFHGVLAHPPGITGPFQNLPHPGAKEQFYADAAVVAYRLPGNVRPIEPKVTTSGGTIARLKVAPKGQKAWIQFAFPQPQAIRAVTLVLTNVPRRAPSAQEFESSDDGQHFRSVVAIPGSRTPPSTISFPAVTAKFFRITFRTLSPVPTEPQPADHQVAEAVLHPDLRVNHFEEKAAFATNPDLYAFPTPTADPGEVVRKADVIDLTSRMHSDGALDWTPPPGAGWSCVLATRCSASPTIRRRPKPRASKSTSSTGAYVKNYFDNYLDQYKDTVGATDGQARPAVRRSPTVGKPARRTGPTI